MLTSDKSKNLMGLGLWLILIAFIFFIPFIPSNPNKELDISFLDNNGNKNALVFFGFRGCSNICPVTLSVLSRLLKSQQDSTYWPQVVFVDIEATSNSVEASNYAKKFHPSFIGLHIPPEKIIAVSSQFGLNIKQRDGQILHIGKTYLLHRQEKIWSLVKAYNPNSFSVKSLTNELFDINS